jgi:hypothetical protein
MTIEEIQTVIQQFRTLVWMEGAEVSIEINRPPVEVQSMDLDLFRRFEPGPELFATIRVRCPVAVEVSK